MASGDTKKPIARLKGHTDSVCCVITQEADHRAVSSGEDGAICVFDLRTYSLVQRIQIGTDGEAAPSIVTHPSDRNTLFASAGSSVCCIDIRKTDSNDACTHRFAYNREEVNQVAVNAKGTLLAAADDAGEVEIIDLAAGTLTRTLSGGHRNICSSVAFRGNRPWEVLSGGLDAEVVRWDFSAGRPLRRWRLAEEVGSNGSPQVCNPPLVHSIATPAESAPRNFSRLFAAARGDAQVAVYDAETDAQSRRARQDRSQGSRRVVGPGDLDLLSRPTYCSNTGHTAAVNHISFPEAGEGRLLLSGGNDCLISLIDWTSSMEEGSEWQSDVGDSSASPQLFCIQHARKVNCLATLAQRLDLVFVGDVSKTLSVYEVT